MKIVLSLWLVILLAGCAPTLAPVPSPVGESPAPTAVVTETPRPAPPPSPQPELGTDANPILLALPPSRFLDAAAVGNGQQLAALLEKQTHYRVVAVAPNTYADLIKSLGNGNAHIAALPMFAIALAYQRDAVQAAYASTQDGAASYGAQFLVRSDRFDAYFDPFKKENTAEAPQALAQFSGKKPCWTETDSPSGSLVPFGILNWYKIPTQEGAFLQSHFAVVRAVRMGEVCDFGATYVDARAYPALKDEYPRIMDEVTVAWQVPAVIPYDGIFLAASVPPNVAAELKRALDLVFAQPNGKVLFDALFKIKGITPVEDLFYVEFTRYLQASGADLNALVH